MLHTTPIPIPVQRLLRKVGADIHDARRRRRISTEVMAARCSISRSTLHKLEKGHPGVGLGVYLTVLFVLGMTDRLSGIADPKNDSVGLQLEAEQLPQRIREKSLATLKKKPRKQREKKGSPQ
jgi:transcriptional regulator with XRE-family HTH domain